MNTISATSTRWSAKHSARAQRNLGGSLKVAKDGSKQTNIDRYDLRKFAGTLSATLGVAGTATLAVVGFGPPLAAVAGIVAIGGLAGALAAFVPDDLTSGCGSAPVTGFLAGRTAFYSNGSSSRENGGTVSYTDGTYGIQAGPLTYRSDGTVDLSVGNVFSARV